MSLNFAILGSGSSGNSYLVWDDEVKILIDAGFSLKSTLGRAAKIGQDLEGLDAVIISHEHSDHCKGAGVISRRYDTNVMANRRTLASLPWSLGKYKTKPFTTGKRFQVHGLSIEPFPLPHDATETVGFTLRKDGKKVTIATDLGIVPPFLSQRLKGSDLIVLEFNHDLDMLRNGRYPAFLKKRISGPMGHLSNEDAASLLCSSIGNGEPIIYSAHLSEDNNEPKLVLKTVKEHLDEAGLKARFDYARRHEPSRVIEL